MISKLWLVAGLIALLIACRLSGQSSATLPSWPLFQFGLFINSALKSLLKATTPPQAWLLNEMTGYLVSKSLYIACKFQWADHLHNGPLSIEELSALAHTDPITTDRVMKYLAVRGVFQRVSEKVYANTAISEYMRKDYPGSMKSMILNIHFMSKSAMGYEASVKNSKVFPFQEAFETNSTMWEYLSRPENKEQKEIFDEAMVKFSEGQFEPLLSDYPWSKHTGTLVDVGGGIGHLAATLLQKYPLKGVVFDLEVESAKKYWKENYSDVIDRAQFVAGSFLDSALPEGDLYVLKHILHDWDDSSSLSILQHISAAMQESKRRDASRHPILLIIDPIYDFPPSFDAVADLDMVLLTLNGKERSVDEFKSLLKEAGMKLTGVVKLRAIPAILEVELA